MNEIKKLKQHTFWGTSYKLTGNEATALADEITTLEDNLEAANDYARIQKGMANAYKAELDALNALMKCGHAARYAAASQEGEWDGCVICAMNENGNSLEKVAMMFRNACKAAKAWKRAAKENRCLLDSNARRYGTSASLMLQNFSIARRHSRKIAREYRQRRIVNNGQ